MEKDSLSENSEVKFISPIQKRVPQRLRLEKLEVHPQEQHRQPRKELVRDKSEEQILSLLVITWNLMGTLPDQHSIRALLNLERMSNDLIIIGTQECQRSLFTSFFCESKESWEGLLARHMEDEFMCIGSDVLQGLHTIAFIRKQYRKEVSELKTNKIKTGFMGVVGNKGAIEMEFYLGERRLLFINSHLQAFQSQSEKRNTDLLSIVQRLINEQPADHIFFFGDLNYRLTITLQQAQRLNKMHQEYLNHKSKDQLIQQQALKKFLSKYKQGDITFPPTYKMSINNNSYSGNRIPGWTDRIFHYSPHPDLEQTSYTCDFGVLGSDHRPVFATFKCALNKSKTPKEIEVKTSNSRCLLF